ncbi:MAG: glycosyltransferase [Chthoniobacterales bacterium]
MKPALSIIVPFYNEGRNVADVCLELKAVQEHMLPECEVILVDDGSTDGSGGTMDRLAVSWPGCRVFHLSENRGQSAALVFGLSHALAPIIATLDGDGQNDPRDIPRLLLRLEGADMVVGVRMERQDSWVRRKISRIANFYRSSWLGDGVSDAGCALKVFRREVADAFIPIRTLYSFMPALGVAAGFRVIEEPVRHRARRYGTSKYSARSFLFLPIVDLIGLKWYCSRRCRPAAGRGLGASAILSLSGAVEGRVARRCRTFAAVGLALLFIGLLVSRPRRAPEGPEARKISLSRAERIALQRFPRGHLGGEELWMDNGRLIFAIDVRSSRPRRIEEVKIDAMDGRVLEERSESEEEEAIEVAAQHHQMHSQFPLPR